MAEASERFECWHRNVGRGSKLYADVSRRRIEAFCRQMRTDPTQFANLHKDPLREKLEDYLDGERRAGHSGDYVRTTLKALRSWLAYNEKEFPKGLKVPNARVHPRIESEEPITTEQLRKAILAANSGQRVVVAFMAHTGVRPQVLGSYDGSDGLRVADLPEMRVTDRCVEFEKIPTMVRVRSTASKAGHGYFTFLGSEGCDYLKQHLEERIRAGEAIGKETDLVSPARQNKRFMTTINVGNRARQALRAAGVETRPYALRSYFFSRCIEAANAGKVSDRYVEFWAGHAGDVTARHYTTGRPNLPSSMIEDMRAAYKRCEPFLSTISTATDGEDAKRLVKVEILKAIGVPADEAERLASDPGTDVAKVVRERLSASKDPPVQRIVAVEEAKSLLPAGWRVVTNAGPGLLVLNPP